MINAIYDLSDHKWDHYSTTDNFVIYKKDIWTVTEVLGSNHYILKKKSRTVKEGTFEEILEVIEKHKLLDT